MMRAMMKRASSAITLAICSAAFVACARQANDAEIRAHFQAKQQPTAPPPKANEAGMYPTPFTAEQIRDATKAGRTYKYKVETEGNPPGERVMTFVPLTMRILPSVKRAWCGRSPETGTNQTTPLWALYETRCRTPSSELMNSSRSFCSS